MGYFAEANDSGITPEWGCVMKKKLNGKIIHIVGPRRLENELLVSFIGKETGADCFVTDFDRIEGYLVYADQEPTRLILIDYREPRLREIFKQASLNGNGSSLARRLISLFNSGKGKDTAERRRTGSSCGILYGCDSTAALLDWMYHLFTGADTSKNGVVACVEDAGETATECPLTWRELQLLMMMTEGLRNREIASRIGISSHTVRTHMYNSFKKIGARNRLEASAWIEGHISMLYLLI